MSDATRHLLVIGILVLVFVLLTCSLQLPGPLVWVCHLLGLSRSSRCVLRNRNQCPNQNRTKPKRSLALAFMLDFVFKGDSFLLLERYTYIHTYWDIPQGFSSDVWLLRERCLLKRTVALVSPPSAHQPSWAGSQVAGERLWPPNSTSWQWHTNIGFTTQRWSFYSSCEAETVF